MRSRTTPDRWSFGISTAIPRFHTAEIKQFCRGYYRNFQQSQPHHIEIIGEKSTLINTIKHVAWTYRIPFVIGRGYASFPPRYELAQRFEASGKDRLILLMLSDHDPDGEEISHSFARSMRDDFYIGDVHPIRVALTAEQVSQFKLPPNLIAKSRLPTTSSSSTSLASTFTNWKRSSPTT